MKFKDQFSGRAAFYAQFRPSYPDELFTWVASLVSNHDVVWDCATGSGQAAVGLASHFKKVIATDASEKQISMAEPHPRIEYRVATAYKSGLADASVSLVTVAQAIHWLDHAAFNAEVKRVLRANGAIAVWGYGDPVIDDEVLDRIVHDYNRGTVESFWMPEREQLLSGLRSIPFPFREVEPPSLTLERWWTLKELAGYLRTWSATAAYAEEHGFDPIDSVEEQLAEHWGGADERHLVKWPLHIRAGYSDDADARDPKRKLGTSGKAP